jgi:nucleotide-binding universal stress UspA family protein
MSKVLLAIESSDFSTAAVEAVREQFRPEETEIHLLHVIDPMVYLPLYDGAVRDFDRIEALRVENRKQAETLVAETAKRLRDARYRVNASIEEGEPRTTIIDCAARVGADLIVLGSHGRRGLPRLLLGSVSEYVARHAPCSVEIVRQMPKAA